MEMHKCKIFPIHFSSKEAATRNGNLRILLTEKICDQNYQSTYRALDPRVRVDSSMEVSAQCAGPLKEGKFYVKHY